MTLRWLNKLGSTVFAIDEYISIVVNPSGNLDQEVFVYLKVKFSTGSLKVLQKAKYIHQLQNLYRELKHEDLKLNKWDIK